MISKLWPPETPPCPAEASTLTAALNQPQPNTTVCTVTGTINADTTPVLRNALAQAHRDDNAHLVIDLSAVTSMDATGLYTLFETLNKHNLIGGGHLALVIDPHSQAIHELHIIALEAAFDLYHDRARALHACTATGKPPHQTGHLPTFDQSASTRPLICHRASRRDIAARHRTWRRS